jgi:transglutaminase-like putative cysteine protease
MPRPGINPQLSVERFFQLAVLCLVSSGYLAVAGSGYIDLPTVVLTGLGLVLRALLVTGLVKLEISDRFVTAITLAYICFYPVDYYFLSRSFLVATVHLVFFLAVMKILTARTNRDYLYTAAIAFLEILAAAILSASLNFLLFLGLYLLAAIAAFTSAEIRRTMQKPHQIARSGLRLFHPRLAALAAFVTLGILFLTAGLFFLLPRSANATLSRLISHRMHVPGFSNEVMLGQIGEFKNDSSTVMHVRPNSRDFPDNLKWRGAALSEFDGKRWSNPFVTGQRIPLGPEGWALVTNRPQTGGRRLFYQVTLNAVDSDALFVAGRPEHMSVAVIRGPNDSVRLGFSPPDNFHYAVTSIVEDPSRAIDHTNLGAWERIRYLQLPPLDPRIRTLAGEVIAGFVTDIQRARSIENHLRTSYGYTLDLPEHETRDPIAYFLFERKKGHCEYFASAMTVMLRAVGIPARIANGFQSGTFNPLSKLYVIRASDAHSWVEAYIDGQGWLTFDPTPADPRGRASGPLAKLSMWTDAAETFWQDWVLRYDLGRQLILAERLQTSSRKLGIQWMDGWTASAMQWGSNLRTWLAGRATALGLFLLLGTAALLGGPRAWRAVRMLHRVRRVRGGNASAGDATLLYGRMLDVLHGRGFQKPVWFTPREFAASLPAETGILVDQFTHAYNELRFGGKLDAAPRLTLLLEELETGRTGVPAL